MSQEPLPTPAAPAAHSDRPLRDAFLKRTAAGQRSSRDEVYACISEARAVQDAVHKNRKQYKNLSAHIPLFEEKVLKLRGAWYRNDADVAVQLMDIAAIAVRAMEETRHYQ